MSSAHKIIKVFAIALAVVIIVNIFSAIIFGITMFAGVIGGFNIIENSLSSENIDENGDIVDITEKINGEAINKEDLNKIKQLRIDLETLSLEIKEGSDFKIEKTNSNTEIKCNLSGDKLTIKEDSDFKMFWNYKPMGKLIIYIPEEKIFDNVKISTGVAKSEISNIKADNFKIAIGAGNTKLNNIKTQNTDIEGGAGVLSINESVLNNLDLKCGVGSTQINADILGKSEIECGVGKVDLELLGNLDSYAIKTKTGIGVMKLNGDRCEDNYTYGNGKNSIKIEGGVGNTEIFTSN